MQIPKQQIIDFIKSKMGDDKAQQADSEMPDQVDTEKDSGLLKKFGVDPSELMGGAAGGLGSKLGL